MFFMLFVVRIITFKLLLLVSFDVYALNISTSKLDLLREQMELLEKQDMFITDVKGVIFYPSDKVLSLYKGKKYKEFLAEIESKYDKEKMYFLDSIVKQYHSFAPVEPEYIELISKIQKRGVKVLVLTSGKSGKYGVVPDLAQLRHDRLNKLGIDVSTAFSDSSKNNNGIILDDDNAVESAATKSSYYANGVIFTNGNDKGKSLKFFLKKVGYTPRRIMMVDNRMSKINSVRVACEKLGIDFVGIHYTKIYEINSGVLDQKIVNKQFEYLEKKHRWLSDSQASCMIEQQDNIEFCSNF